MTTLMPPARSIFATRPLTTAALMLALTACTSGDGLPAEPVTGNTGATNGTSVAPSNARADLVVTSIAINDQTGTQVIRSRVSTPVRFRVAVRNVGNAPMAASMVRVRTRGSKTIGDIAVPSIAAGREVTVEGSLVLPTQLLSDYDRAQAERYTVEACANITETQLEASRWNNCADTPGAVLMVQPNFERDCGALPITPGAVVTVNGSTVVCSLGVQKPGLVRSFEVVTPGTYRITLERLNQPDVNQFYAVVRNDDGDGVAHLIAGTSTPKTLVAELSRPGRYYLTTSGPGQYRVTFAR